MPLTREQILAPYPETEAIADVLAVGEALGFELQSWESNDPTRIVVMALARLTMFTQSVAASIVNFFLNDTAEGTALEVLSAQNFGNTKGVATPTIGWLHFVGAAIGPPHTIKAGQGVFSDGTLLFRNVADVAVTAGGTVDAQCYCETPGAAGNVAMGTITQMLTPYAGVTVSNPEYGTTGTWISTLGQDAETEAALKARNSATWSERAPIEAMDDRYELAARESLTNCRVAINSTNPRGPNTIDIWLAREADECTTDERNAVANVIAAKCFGGAPLLQVYRCPKSNQTFVGTVYYRGTLATVQAAVQAAISNLVDKAPIGGNDYSPGPSGVILFSKLIAAVQATYDSSGTLLSGVAGVIGFVPTTPSADITVPAYSIKYASDFSGLTYTAV